MWRVTKGNKKSFYRCIRSKKKPRENVGLLLNGMGDLVAKDMQKVEVLSAIFTLIFIGKIGVLQSQILEAHGKI